jgi:hypothetical protein
VLIGGDIGVRVGAVVGVDVPVDVGRGVGVFGAVGVLVEGGTTEGVSVGDGGVFVGMDSATQPTAVTANNTTAIIIVIRWTPMIHVLSFAGHQPRNQVNGEGAESPTTPPL